MRPCRDSTPGERTDMIPTDIVRDLMSLTAPQLAHLRKLHLIPRPTRVATIGRGGSTYAYPESVVNRLRLIALLRAKGVPLTQIAKHVKGTPMECCEE